MELFIVRAIHEDDIPLRFCRDHMIYFPLVGQGSKDETVVGIQKGRLLGSMSFVVRLISGQQEWYERIFREKAVRLIAVFGQEFDITIDEVEDYFGETQEVSGESLNPGELLQPNDTVIGTCRWRDQ